MSPRVELMPEGVTRRCGVVRRGAFAAGVASWALWLAAGCGSGESLGASAHGSLACVDDAGLGPCCGKVAKQVSAASLSIDTCSGSAAYALCDGLKFECEYVCALPAGFTVTTADASASCADARPPEDAPSARTVAFDGGGLGPCSDHVVAPIPAGACAAACPGSLAYAVCAGESYLECACNVPPGYVLSALAEAGAADGTMDAPIADARTGEGG
jgi:hypothetical protein